MEKQRVVELTQRVRDMEGEVNRLIVEVEEAFAPSDRTWVGIGKEQVQQGFSALMRALSRIQGMEAP